MRRLKSIRWMGRQNGFTLIEMAVVVVIVGIVISIVATVLPSLIKSSKIKKARAILEKTDYALEGYLSANGRAPCPDTDGDGQENRNDNGTPSDASDDTCSSYSGDLPYATLGLSSGYDNWRNRLRYGVYEDLIKTNTSGLCTSLSSFVATPNTSWLRTNDGSVSSPQAWVVVSGGAQDMDGSGGFFDSRNETAPDAEFESPSKIVDTTYDDLVTATSLTYINGKICTGGSGGSGGSGGTTAENCSNGIDDDGDSLVDCVDPDCAANVQCLSAPQVTIVGSTIPATVMGQTLSHTFQATGGESAPDYYWSLVSTPLELAGKITLNTWSGALSGTMDVCFSASPLTIRVKAEDRSPDPSTPLADTYDERDFQIEVVAGSLTIRPTPSELPDPDISVNATTFSQEFRVEGDYLGPFESLSAWHINWSGSDPGGFQIDPLSATSAKFWKSSSSTAGDFTFTITVTDDNCPANTATNGPYTLHISAAGAAAPYTEGMQAEWRFDECSSWDGASFDVADALGNSLHFGRANGFVAASHSGKLCRAARFFGGSDKIVSDVLTGADIMIFNDQVSLACWFKSPGGGSGSPRLLEFSNDTGGYQWSTALVYDVDGSLRAWVTSVAGQRGGQVDYSGQLYNDNVWHHAVYTYSAANGGRLYVDGALKQSATDHPTADIVDAETFVMGGYYVDNNNGYVGLIDEAMVFNRELTADETLDLFHLTRSDCPGACYTSALGDYRMENFPWNGTADEVQDSGSGANQGTAVAAGSGSRPEQTTPSGGKVCRAATFARVDPNNGGYLDLGDPSDGDLDPGSNGWTVSAWINWDGSPGEQIIYNKENLYEAKVNSGYVQYAWQPHWYWDGGTSFAIDADTWTYLTTVYDGSEQILYKNGVRVYSRSQSGAMGGNNSKLLLGARGNLSPYNFFSGLIDEVKIYDRPQSESEIRADMEASRDCAADSVVILSTTLPDATVGQSGYDSSPDPIATGGTAPYVWEIVSQDALTLTMPDVATGLLEGDINVCQGTYPVTLRVTDAAGRIDEAPLPLTVTNGPLSVSGLPSDLTCSTTTCSWDFTVSGDRVGQLGNWQINWQGAGPGGFEVVATGANSARLRKIGTSTAGSNFRFGLTAEDDVCSTLQLDTGYVYFLDVAAGAEDPPYYADMLAEWLLDACTWNSAPSEVIDSSGNGYHGTAHTTSPTSTDDRMTGKVCRAAALNLNGVSGEYVTLGADAFNNLGDFSLGLWFRMQSGSSDLDTLFSGARAGHFNNLLIYLDNGASIVRTWVNDTQTGQFNIGASVQDGQWHHLIWTRAVASGSETIYLDGTALTDSNAGADTQPVSLDSGGAIIGQEQDSLGGGFAPSQAFHGWIDEVRLFDKVLAQTEVNALMALAHTCSGTCYSAAVAEYRMDEDGWITDQAGEVTNTMVDDYHGTPHGSAAVNSGDSHLCRSGQFSNADSTVQIDNLTMPTNADEMATVTFWMKWDGGGSQMPMGWQQGYDLYFQGTARFGFNTGAGDLFGIDGAAALAGDWHHVAAIFNNAAPLKNQLFIDGALQPITLLAGTPVNRSVTPTLHLSGWGPNDSYKFNGLLDEVRVYGRGLAANEVIADMDLVHGCP